LSIVFYNGAIKWLEVKTLAISTVDGAKIGMTLTAIKTIYGAKGTELKDGLGGRALSVHDKGGLGLFFRAANGEAVSLIEAGPRETLEFVHRGRGLLTAKTVLRVVAARVSQPLETRCVRARVLRGR
jgi:hypothetical protein